MQAPAAPALPQLHAIPSACRFKVGLDLGTTTTVFHELTRRAVGPAEACASALPTLLGYPRGGARGDARARSTFAIGEAAAQHRDHLDLVSPLEEAVPLRGTALLDFARALRHVVLRGRMGRPWGVVACPAGQDACGERELRAVAGELFERLLLVEEPLLHAVALLEEPISESGLVVDIGARKVRASLVSQLLCREEHRAALPGGGWAVDAILKARLLERYPDLVLSDLTLTRMKEQLSFVAPAAREAKVRLMLGRSRCLLDITDAVTEACESMVQAVLKAIRRVLANASSELVGRVLGNIFLVGGGAATLGLRERVQAELKREGLSLAVVHTVHKPRDVLARGALKWALLTPDEAWEIPLFAFRPV